MTTPLPTNYEYAQALDAADNLSRFRNEFVHADEDLIYVDGNSLGQLPFRTIERMQAVIAQEWGQALIRGWNMGWYEAPSRIGAKLAQLVGAAENQVIACDSTSVNLFKLIIAALKLRSDRPCIVSDTLNFPSDLYVLQGCVDLLGQRHQVHQVPSTDTISIDIDAMCAAIDETTALVTLSHVVFKSGFLHDMAAITKRAHEVGALVLWDLSHSVGAAPIELDRCGVDFAVGCSYKYLNGGPGAPAFLYVRRDLQDQITSPIWGWLGHQTPFTFDTDYEPAEGMSKFLSGTPPMLSLLAVEPALDLMLEAGMESIRHKSVGLSSYFIELFDAMLAPLNFTLGSPRAAAQRGSHVSIRHPEGYRINRALIDEMQVLPDFREPDNIRVGIAPLYNSYSDIWETAQRIRTVVEEERYVHYPEQRLSVT
ncbi:MAG: kynureninase [Chloroflexi bacterium AL-W]|nr:kynureninase [Chloroflexi bacterium AL-N1]NOK68774.1 kynureninase [Chloroflexi bacterium AL-N10]NOK76260.1 kynureninase [Chloroflexi bacterium AL-N5]NOK84103.1 kynureninase [Chloroflexi bacterium AL-W]NOK91398.1 kynureninase [Chloroflexi bacterium AL-N15]